MLKQKEFCPSMVMATTVPQDKKQGWRHLTRSFRVRFSCRCAPFLWIQKNLKPL